MIPSPEELQFLLGLHPSQTMANQALLGGAVGDQPGNTEVSPASQPAPTAKTDAAPVEVAPRPSLIPRPGPRGLDVPPVNTPGPIAGTVATGTADAAGRPMLTAAGPRALPIGAVPPGPPKVAPEPAPPVDMSSIGGLMTTPIRPISGDQAQEQKDRAEVERLRTTGSGVSQFQQRHKFLGPIIRGLDIAGTVLAPGTMSLVPGTELHHKELIHEANQNVERDIGQEKAHSSMVLGEEAQQARIQANRIREEGMQDKINQGNAKFVAGSEREDPNSPTGWVAMTVGGETKAYTPPASYKQTKGEVSEEEFKQRNVRADKLGLQGDDRKYFLANGKLREPNQQADEDRAARLQRQREHDQDARMNHYQAEHARWAEHKSAIEKEQEQGYARIENDWRKKYGPTGADVLDSSDSNAGKKEAMADLGRQKKLLEDSVATRFKELGPEPSLPSAVTAPVESAPVAPASGNADIEQPIAPVRTPAKASSGTQPKPSGTDIGPAPDGSPEGRTGKLPDGTKVIVKGGRLVAQ